MTGYKSKELTANGKRKITFDRSAGYSDLPLKLPCGQCIGCRLERSRQWALRCVHEASLYDHNTFITLTYNNQSLPEDGSLNKKHFQKFMKRYRKKYPHLKIRFFHCGEYGTKNKRPHYHAIIFNHDFTDKELWQNRKGTKLYTSKTLQSLWPHGFSTIGDVTFESAAYVARYIMKKVTGDQAESHYQAIDPETGEIHTLQPEYTTMSRKPGIAHDWYNRYKTDVYPSDFIILKGQKMKPPKYYDTIYELEQPLDFAILKTQRNQTKKKNRADNTPKRLLVKEKCKQAKLKSLIRPYEDETS